ncbi:anti-sigma factor [Neobacillus cucumis]|uniref:anti sigma factor C-terminal domain-containing protein n=1 Tax=Neobacillus cucumis TaxID=1740721 RepID=UPI00203F443C|nr:anti sigma factor C-terminal domain-containing protein [Neobacillus cucumis]MCM3729979.1 anti-sigma factor [Neobacillus cucumis]
MFDKNNEQFDLVFDDKSLGKTLKKAKRVTLFRTIIISAIVCILLVFTVYKVNMWWVSKIGGETATDLIKQDAIMKAPNTIVKTETIDYGFLKGTIKREVFKVVEDKIIPWETQEANFGFRGFKSTSFSSSSTKIDEDTYIHIPNGEKEMLFYVPQYRYKTYANDLSELKDYPNDKYIELGVSFNKGYSLNEVKKMLPTSVHPMWYWVNDYPNKAYERDEPESGQWFYGIYDPTSKVGQAMSSPKIKSELAFLRRLKMLDKSKSYYTLVKNHQKDGMIIGAVVTGTKDSLLELKDQPYVKASSIGAVVDKY